MNVYMTQTTTFIYPFFYDLQKVDSLKDQENELGIWRLRRFAPSEERTKYFLPYVNRIMFPTIMKSTENFRISDYLKDNTFVELILEEKETSSEIKLNCSMEIPGKDKVITFYIKRIALKLCPGRIGMLIIETSLFPNNDDHTQPSIPIEEVMFFNSNFRYLCSPYSAYELPIIKISNAFNKEKLKVTELIDFLTRPILKDITKGEYDWQRVYEDRLITHSFICVDNTEDENNKDLKLPAQDERIFVPIYLLNPSLPKEGEKLSFDYNEEEYNKVMVTHHLSSRYGFSREGSFLLTSTIGVNGEDDLFGKDPDRGLLYWNTYYLDMYILAIFYRIALLNMSWDLNVDNTDKMVEGLRKWILDFTNKLWFYELTNYDFGMKLWQRCLNALNLKELYDGVRGELAELEQYLSDKDAKRKENKFNILTMAALPLGLYLAFLGANFPFEADLTWNLLSWLGIFYGFGILVGIIIYSYDKRKNKE